MTEVEKLYTDVSGLLGAVENLHKTAHDMNNDNGQSSDLLREIVAQLSAATSALGVAKRRAGELIQ